MRCSPPGSRSSPQGRRRRAATPRGALPLRFGRQPGAAPSGSTPWRRATTRGRPGGRRGRRAGLRPFGVAPVGAVDLPPPLGPDHPRVSGKSSASRPGEHERPAVALGIGASTRWRRRTSPNASFVTAYASIRRSRASTSCTGSSPSPGYAQTESSPMWKEQAATSTSVSGCCPPPSGTPARLLTARAVVFTVTRDAARASHGASVPVGLRSIPLHVRTRSRPRAPRAGRTARVDVDA